ncbi:MAG: hypothetical protein K5929_03355 [Lachnospiraceae bacterium]|nr:hypothetical protein [Lachnospiraceae bacterium]
MELQEGDVFCSGCGTKINVRSSSSRETHQSVAPDSIYGTTVG